MGPHASAFKREKDTRECPRVYISDRTMENNERLVMDRRQIFTCPWVHKRRERERERGRETRAEVAQQRGNPIQGHGHLLVGICGSCFNGV